ncbi:Glycosyltransferase [Quillaja saponaria]|uniref:Glycosyltransferase n=1 Tax=Quillaja saponaria TaxID=32244 RepID=A0AAD7P785_QUISA|nr:Glycosyltransferase [Quillaja saponaria]
MAANPELHVLMVSQPYQGHLNPMLKFAIRLASKGIHVTLATTEIARHRMFKHKTSIASHLETDSENPSIQLAFFSDGLTLDFDRDANFDSYLNSMRIAGSENFSKLVTNLTNKGQKFSCIIVNPFVPWFVDVAVDHGIPCAMLWIQACAIYSIYYRYFKNVNPFPKFENPNESFELPGIPSLKVKDLPSFILPSSLPCFYEIVSEFVKRLDKVNWVLGSSFYELEEEIVKSMDSLTPIYPIGPLVSPLLLGEKESDSVSVDMWNTEDSCIKWLDNKQECSVIYISFGSITVLNQQQVDNIAMALKNTKKPFLWVMKPPEKDSDKKIGELPSEFLEETKGMGLVVTWCPQEKVLMHKAVGCFMTHCGWNSTLETVVAGVPVIGHPNWTDQPTNSFLLAQVFKNGVRMKFGEDGVVGAEEVERCIMEVMEGPRSEEMRSRAMEFKVAAKKALEIGGSSYGNIKKFISEIIGKST